jgi:predicted small lipoprotein YifL
MILQFTGVSVRELAGAPWNTSTLSPPLPVKQCCHFSVQVAGAGDSGEIVLKSSSKPTLFVRSGLNVKCALALAALLALAGCNGKGGPPAFPPPDVNVIKAASEPVTLFEEYVGQTEAVDTVEIRARVSGLLDKQSFEDGGRVAAGSVLFVIDPQPFKAALDAGSETVMASFNAVNGMPVTGQYGPQVLFTLHDANGVQRDRRHHRALALADRAIAASRINDALWQFELQDHAATVTLQPMPGLNGDATNLPDTHIFASIAKPIKPIKLEVGSGRSSEE